VSWATLNGVMERTTTNCLVSLLSPFLFLQRHYQPALFHHSVTAYVRHALLPARCTVITAVCLFVCLFASRTAQKVMGEFL